MFWSNFLHIYQPPTQKEIWVRRIADESYRKIFSGLLNIPSARLTLNINGILCELLDRYEGRDVLENIKILLERGNLELTGSSKYHAFLPLLPENEIERQIKLNEQTLDKYFGDSWKKNGKRGFFSPEMAYSKKVALVAKRLGYQWIIADELGFQGNYVPRDTLNTIKDIDDFSIFFRERNLSFIILSAQVGTMPTVIRHLGERVKGDGFAITAMDGETFGHHRPGLETLLFDLFKEKSIKPIMISDLPKIFSNKTVIEPRESTWALTKKDLAERLPFARWQDPENQIQKWQWQMTDLAISVVNRNPGNEKIREMLDSALHSDQYWWASARPWWSLEMIERGAHELETVVINSENAKEAEKKLARELYQNIIYTGFEWQRIGFVDEIARKDDEEIQERLEEKEKLFVTKAEYQEMIKTLEEQMKLAAKSEEFHRAAMIKDRIRELKEEMEKAKQ